MLTSQELRQKYLKFFEKRGHKIIPSSSLVPENDPSTLFISAGMQPLVPNLLGQPHPEGKRIVDCQKCLRTGDIEEVGDSYHHTFFEMLGNWSLGDYFKKESIPWSLEFLTKELGITMNRLWVTVFAGDEDAPRDMEAFEIWKSLSIPEERIFFLGKDDNWWAAGPTGPCGPDTEIFYDVTQLPCGPDCKPGDSCGRFFEIWNNVFMVYNRKTDGSLEELPKKNVDTGMGLERTLAILNGLKDNYQTDLLHPLIYYIESIVSGKTIYNVSGHNKDLRIIADHIRAATFLINDGVVPSNKLQGYVLRRLIRRAAVKLFQIEERSLSSISGLIDTIRQIYKGTGYFSDQEVVSIKKVLEEEVQKFQKTLNKGLKEIQKISKVDGKIAFDLYQTYGFPLEITTEIFLEKGQQIDLKEFEKEFENHKNLSRTASAGMFKGGLSDHSEETTRLHTATHLLHQALRTILGKHVEQKGSNITVERLRFDFSHSEKLTQDELKKVEDLINQKIKESLPVNNIVLPREEAEQSGALHFFGDKYSDKVSIYYIGDSLENAFSKEFCGGPHVKNTSEIKGIKITKEESAGSGLRRIYASLL